VNIAEVHFIRARSSLILSIIKIQGYALAHDNARKPMRIAT